MSEKSRFRFEDEELNCLSSYYKIIFNIIDSKEVLHEFLKAVMRSKTVEEALRHYGIFKEIRYSIMIQMSPNKEWWGRQIKKHLTILEYFKVKYPPIPKTVKKYLPKENSK